MGDEPRKLFRSKDHPDHWIGEDEHGVLMVWPARPKGWAKRTAYAGAKRQLEEAEPALARGTGWPFGPVGRRPRDGEAYSTLGIRVSASERAKWQRAADKHDRNLTVWARDELNAAADRTLDESDSLRPRSKNRP
jgi:hypothetical protein